MTLWCDAWRRLLLRVLRLSPWPPLVLVFARQPMAIVMEDKSGVTRLRWRRVKDAVGAVWRLSFLRKVLCVLRWRGSWGLYGGMFVGQRRAL